MLDFAATTKLPEADVTVTITGPASRPVIALSSSPTLPQDEIMARLLFGKASGALSPFEAVQLAQAMAQLTGVGGGGPGVLDKIRKGLGLDRLDLEAREGSATSAPKPQRRALCHPRRLRRGQAGRHARQQRRDGGDRAHPQREGRDRCRRGFHRQGRHQSRMELLTYPAEE